MSRWIWAMVGLTACGGEETSTDRGLDGQDPADYACFHIAEGAIVDASSTRDGTATELVPSLEPYRVNLRPNPEVGYLRIESSGPREVLLLLDREDTATAFWAGEQRTELGIAEPDPFCTTDIPAMHTLSLSAGTDWIELGPSYWASVWLMVTEP